MEYFFDAEGGSVEAQARTERTLDYHHDSSIITEGSNKSETQLRLLLRHLKVRRQKSNCGYKIVIF